MLNRKSMKVILTVVLAVVMLMVVGSSVFAATKIPQTEFNNSTANNIAGTVLGALKWGAIMIAAGMLIYIGIKYMTSAPDGKAQMKQQLTIYIVGFVLAVAAATIVGMLETTLSGAGATSGGGTSGGGNGSGSLNEHSVVAYLD